MFVFPDIFEMIKWIILYQNEYERWGGSVCSYVLSLITAVTLLL